VNKDYQKSRSHVI